MLVRLGKNLCVNPEHVSTVIFAEGSREIAICFLGQEVALKIQVPDGMKPQEFLDIITEKINGENNA